MQMIDVLKRLAELDAQNPNIVKEAQQPVEECGMMGGMGASHPHSPASINMTAATGEELSSMLKDIMTLAGQSKAEPEMPMGGADGIAVVDVEPSPEVGADDNSVMRSMIDKLNPSDDEEKVDEYDNTPDEQVAGYDAAVPSGNDLHKEKQQYPAAQRGDNAMAVTYESLMAEYRKFLGEDQNSAEGMSDHEDEYSIRSAVLDVLQTIYDGASAGEEMIDTVADELGDHYDEVEQSGDNELMNAYRFVREKGADAEGNPEMMAKVVQQAMSVLGKDQGTAEGKHDEYPGPEGDYDNDPLQARANDSSWQGQGSVYKPLYPGDKRGMSKSYAYDIKRTGPKGHLPEQGVAEADTMESMLVLAGLKK